MTDGTRARRRPANSDQEKLQRHDEIIAAAKKVFARNGFHATTIADIAKEADLSYGSVYWYFARRCRGPWRCGRRAAAVGGLDADRTDRSYGAPTVEHR
jgi:Bacterial regulatory proteins, tetR family